MKIPCKECKDPTYCRSILGECEDIHFEKKIQY
jgi:hypothetical protein